MKRKVNVGKGFDCEVKVVDARTRKLISITILVLSTILLVGAAAMGLIYDHDFGKLQGVWSVIGPIFGVIGTYYYQVSSKR